MEALWSDEPTGSPPLIGSILRQETIKEPFLPPPILIDFSSMFPFTKRCLLLPPCSRRRLLDKVPLPHFCLICLFPWKWICATQGAHVCVSCLENTIIHPFLHKSLSDPPLPSRTPPTHPHHHPPQLLSAQPGSVRRKQLPPMSAHLLMSRCILGMEQCVTRVVRLTVCDVPLQ